MSDDTERMNFLAETLEGVKWADHLPSLRPRDAMGYTEKYIDRRTFRDAIDAAMSLRKRESRRLKNPTSSTE